MLALLAGLGTAAIVAGEVFSVLNIIWEALRDQRLDWQRVIAGISWHWMGAAPLIFVLGAPGWLIIRACIYGLFRVPLALIPWTAYALGGALNGALAWWAFTGFRSPFLSFDIGVYMTIFLAAGFAGGAAAWCAERPIMQGRLRNWDVV